MGDLIEFLVFMVVCIVVVCVGLVGVVCLVDYLSCIGFAQGTGIETRWSWGCYANVGGEWVPSKYVFGQAHELRVR